MALQDEMQEIKEKEEQDRIDAKTAEEKVKHQQLMKEANLEGVETMVEDMLKEDPEYSKLKEVPNLMDPLTDFQDKFNMVVEEFKVSRYRDCCGGAQMPRTFTTGVLV